jgi:hypothetical protein
MTTYLNNLILATARKLKDERTSAASSDDTGHVYSSALLTEYANRAVRNYLAAELNSLGIKAFARKYPEYVKQSSALSLSSGSVAKPADALFVFDLVLSDLSLRFDPISQENVAQALAGEAGLGAPSATHPGFYEESGNIKTLGVTSGTVLARYISVHPDLAVITTATSVGIIYTTAANLTWTAATKLLTVDGELHLFDTIDPTNQIIQFWKSGVVYTGRVSSYHITIGGDAEVYVQGEALPASDITPSSLLGLAISGHGPEADDLKLNEHWHGEILERMVQMGQADAERLTQQ